MTLVQLIKSLEETVEASEHLGEKMLFIQTDMAAEIPGHEEMKYNPEDKSSLERVKKRFKEELAKGKTAYRLMKGTHVRELIREFDEKADGILVVAGLVGG